MAEIGTLSVDLRMATAKFTQAAQGVERKLGSMGKAASAANKILGSLLAIGGTAAFSGMIKGSIDAADRLGKLSTRLGIAVEDLSRLEYAAELTGVSQTTLATGLQRMTRRISEAANGSGEAVKSLNELGLSAVRLNQVSPARQFEVLADALQQVENPADKIRLSVKLLDSEAIALLQTMAGGSAGLREFARESDATGNTISTKMADAAADANDAFFRLNSAAQNVTKELFVYLGPTLVEVARWLTAVIPKASNFTVEAFNTARFAVAKLAEGFLENLRRITKPLSLLSDVVLELDIKYKLMIDTLKDQAEAYKQQSLLTTEVGDETETFTRKLNDAAIRYKRIQEEIKELALVTGELRAKLRQLNEEQAAATPDRKKITDIDELIEYYDTLLEVERDFNKRKKELLKSYESNDFEEQLNIKNKLQELEKDHQIKITKIQKEAKNARAVFDEQEKQQKVAALSTTFSSLATLMDSGSKKLFKIGKMAAIADAVVNTATAVTKALAGPPWPYNLAAAAAVAAKGAVQIAAIKSQQFSSGGTVAAPGAGGSVGTPIYEPPRVEGAGSDTGRAVNLYINNVNGRDALELLEDLRDEITNTDFTLIEGNSANAQVIREQF